MGDIVKYRRRPRGRLKIRDTLGGIAVMGAIVAGSASVPHIVETGSLPSFATLGLDPSCDIKGNISFSGERIYHVRGQDYYAETRIRPEFGERWFCSEAEARKAGWRRSKR